MENAQLIGLSRQMVLRRELDVIANNLANIETGGYRRHAMMFEEHIMPVAQFQTERAIDRNLSYVSDRATYVDFDPGALKRSGNPLDVAITGPGWFAVETPDGERYTRNGSFQINTDGELITTEGYRVLGNAGPVLVGQNAADIEIAGDGTISTADQELGQLRVVEFEDMNGLDADGTTTFASEVPPVAATQSAVVQGMVEGSNVQGVTEVTRMIEVTRTYVSVSQMISRMNELREEAIDGLARVPQA